jgi:hypothetical protein
VWAISVCYCQTAISRSFFRSGPLLCKVLRLTPHSHAAKMTGPAGPSLRTRLPGPVRNPQVVPGRIEDPEVLQAPRPVLEILRHRPSRRHHPVALSNDVINFEHQLHPGGRQPRGTGIRNYPPDGTDTHATPLQRDILIPLIAPIGGEAETQDAHIEINGGVKIAGEDLEMSTITDSGLACASA